MTINNAQAKCAGNETDIQISNAPCDEFGECSSECMCTEVGVRCDCDCATDGDKCIH